METPQTIIVGNTAAPQSSVGLQPAYPQSNDVNVWRNKITVKGLAIAEIVLGSLCMLISILILAVPVYYYGPTTRFIRTFNIGEGLWCGVWIVISGTPGIPIARENASRRMINIHLALNIIGAVFAAVMFTIGIIAGLINSWSGFRMIFYSFEALFALTLFILCIISASYSCVLLGCCCCQTVPSQSFGTQMYNQQQPQILGQGASAYPQSNVMQTQPHSQPMPAATSDVVNSFSYQQLTPSY